MRDSLELLLRADRPPYERLRRRLKVVSSTANGCYGAARRALIVSVRAGDVEWVRERVVLSPQTTECTVPGEVIQKVGTGMMQFIAYGDEVNLAHPPRPQDPKDYGVPLVEKDVIGILDALGIQQVQLVAHDWGAAVGWRLAADYPTRITRYIAMSVGAPGGRTSIQQREKSWYMLFFRQTGVAEQQLMANNWELFREWSRNPVDIDHWISNLARPGALTAALNWYRATGGAPAPGNPSGPPPQVQCPVLGLWSDGDHYLTEYPMKSSGDRVKGPFEYARIAGASHWMMVDKPAEINAKLLGFLKK